MQISTDYVLKIIGHASRSIFQGDFVLCNKPKGHRSLMLTKQARKLQDAQAEKLTSLQANNYQADKLTS